MKSINPKNVQGFIFLLIGGGVIILALAGYLKPVIGIASDPFISFQRYVATRTQAIIEFFTVPRDMASLRAQNSALEDEVAKLQSQVIALQQQLSEADVLYALLDFAREQPENQYIASSVIGRDPSPFMHYVIIDHGSDDGIRHGMPVVTQQGLVGRIDAVTSKAARVQLITDPGSLVNVKLESSKVTGQMVGSITGEITLELIPQDLEFNPGEIVLTSGLGGAYPADILIGQIVDVNVTDTALFQTATIQAVVDISNLNAVLVITNFRPVETEPLIPTAIP